MFPSLSTLSSSQSSTVISRKSFGNVKNKELQKTQLQQIQQSLNPTHSVQDAAVATTSSPNTPHKLHSHGKATKIPLSSVISQQQLQQFSLPIFLQSFPGLQSALVAEYQCLKQLLYKNCSQHRKASYFHRLMGVRRRAQSINWDELKVIVDTVSSEKMITSSADVYDSLLPKIDDFRLLCSECLLASQILIALLEQTYFMPFALTTISMMSRILTVSRNILYGLLSLLQSPALNSIASISANNKTVLQALFAAFRKGSEVEIFTKCYYVALLTPINWSEHFPEEQVKIKEDAQSEIRTKIGSQKRKLSSITAPAMPSSAVVPPGKQSLLFSYSTSLQQNEQNETQDKPIVAKPSLLTTSAAPISTFSLLMDATLQSKKKKMKKISF